MLALQQQIDENGKTESRKMAIILFSKFCEDNNIIFNSLEEDETYGTNKKH